jgi:hypothetical protein
MAVFFITRFQEAKTLLEATDAKKIHSIRGIEIWSGESHKFVLTGLGRDRMSVGVASYFSDGFWNQSESSTEFTINYGSSGCSDVGIPLRSMHLIHGIHDLSTKRDVYTDQIFHSPFPTLPLITSPLPVILRNQSEWKKYIELPIPKQPTLYDMEGISFFNSANQCIGSPRIILLKYVSDHCDGKSCEPSLYSKIDPNPVLQWIKGLESKLTTEHSSNRNEISHELKEKWKLSESSFNQLSHIIRYFQRHNLQTALEELQSYNPDHLVKKDTINFINSVYAKYILK